MSRFKDYMPEMEGKYDITTCPVFEEGQKCSVGIGGTGTVVTQQSANTDLAAEFLCWAKMSDEGEQNIWDTLGFDVCTRHAGQMMLSHMTTATSTMHTSETIRTMY